MRAISILGMTALVCSCTFPVHERTQLQQTPPYFLYVDAVSNWRDVSRTGRNAVSVAPGGIAGIRVLDRTDGTADAEFVLPSGGNCTLYLGTTPHRLRSAADSGHVLRIGELESTLHMDNGMVHRIEAGIPRAKPTIVEIVNDGQWMVVSVGCATPLRVKMQRPSTEWIIVSAENGCNINDPSLTVLYEIQVNKELQSLP